MALAALALSTSINAEDLLPPVWRGGIRTTFQNWTFEDDDNPALPEYIANPYGSAIATMTLKPYPGDEGWQAALLNRDGIWPDLDTEPPLLKG